MLGPFVVVVASLASAWIAIRSDDGLVAQDYYKRGLLINKVLQDAPADPLDRLGATITVGPGGAVRVHFDGLTGAPNGVRLTLGRPASGGGAQVVALERGGDGDYHGSFTDRSPGRWIVTLQADGWRLPTTTVVGHPAEIRLGAAERS